VAEEFPYTVQNIFVLLTKDDRVIVRTVWMSVDLYRDLPKFMDFMTTQID